MANFENNVLTDNGLRLLTRSASGNAPDALKLTKMAIGRGIIPETTDVRTMTDLYQRIESISASGFLDIIRFDITGLSVSQVTCLITNDAITEQIPIFQVGVYAFDSESDADVLYEIAYTRSTPAIIDPPRPTPFSVELSLVTIISEAENVHADIVFPMYAGSIRYDNNKSKLAARDVQNAMDELKEISDGIQNVIINMNDSAVTTAGVALSKSGNTLNHQNYGVAGTYAKVTTNAQGHVVSGQAELNSGDIADVAWSKVTGKPTTISGYGITDAAPKSHVGTAGISQHPLGNGTAAGFSTNDFTAELKTKLESVVVDATKVNVVDSLTSISTTDALSAAQGKTLNDNKLDLSGGTMTGELISQDINIADGAVLKYDGTTIISDDGVIRSLYNNDIAELFPRGDDEIEPGDVLAYDWRTDSVMRARKEDKVIVGVCSDTYGFLLGGDKSNRDKCLAVALAGRVDVKVTGHVDPGNILTISGISGVAARKGKGGCVIGKALAPHDGDTIDRISMLVVM
ncbi:MAG: hypothetical protein LBB94_03460 [Clostridiales bacterium]|nr:hypothetical protein [Clostridiales bacterium]